MYKVFKLIIIKSSKVKSKRLKYIKEKALIYYLKRISLPFSKLKLIKTVLKDLK